MAKRQDRDIAALIEDEVAAIEADRDAPIPDSANISRGHGRSKTLQVRLNPDEFAELERLAANRGLPTSTVAREAIMRLIRPEVARTVAASRLVDEFARYIDTIGVVEGEQLTGMPRTASSVLGLFPHGVSDMLPSIGAAAELYRRSSMGAGAELYARLLKSGGYGDAMARLGETMLQAMAFSPQVGGLARLCELAEHDLKYEVYTDREEKYRFRVKAPDGEIILTSGAFESRSEAKDALADLQETIGEMSNAEST
jgi:uncharacterized protein YegP (UPF0339 family)